MKKWWTQGALLFLWSILFVSFVSVTQAAVLIENFCDVDHSQCSDIEHSLTVLEDTFSEVSVVYYSLPSSSPESIYAALALECARDQHKFEELKELLYTKSQAPTRSTLKSYAAQLGLYQANFSFCLDTREKEYALNEQISYAERKGVTAAPTVLINGKKQGYLTYDEYKVLVERARGALPAQTVPTSNEQENSSVSEIQTQDAGPLAEECAGCFYDGTCLTVGMGANGMYCDPDGSMKILKQNGARCSGSVECASNLCTDGLCANPIPSKTPMYQRFIAWFKGVFA